MDIQGEFVDLLVVSIHQMSKQEDRNTKNQNKPPPLLYGITLKRFVRYHWPTVPDLVIISACGGIFSAATFFASKTTDQFFSSSPFYFTSLSKENCS